jgi:hypothetical protein
MILLSHTLLSLHQQTKLTMAKVYFKVLTKIIDPKKEVSIRIRIKDGKIDQSVATGESVQL